MRKKFLTKTFLLIVAVSLTCFAFAKKDYHVYSFVARGVVKDPDGNALAGAAVTEKGTNNSVVAGANRDFVIRVKKGASANGT